MNSSLNPRVQYFGKIFYLVWGSPIKNIPGSYKSKQLIHHLLSLCLGHNSTFELSLQGNLGKIFLILSDRKKVSRSLHLMLSKCLKETRAHTLTLAFCQQNSENCLKCLLHYFLSIFSDKVLLHKTF